MKKNNKRRRKSEKKQPIFTAIGILMTITTLIFLGIIYILDVIPTSIFIGIFIFFGLLDLSLTLILLKKNIKTKIKNKAAPFGIILTIIMIIISIYLGRTLGFLWSIKEEKTKVENYSIVVLKDSSYNDLKDLDQTEIGYYSNTDGIDQAIEELEKRISSSYIKYSDPNDLVDKLYDGTLQAILVEDSIYKILEEEIPTFKDKTRVLYSFSIKVDIESTIKDVDVTKTSFNIYISGIDTYGEISSVSRSDVNMIMTINPNTKQILLTSIPRDYYVQLHNTTGLKDKLTHAGIYGIDMSIQTIEDLLGIDINYYIKVNFTSVVDIVNAIGGITVYSEYTFTSQDGYNYTKGYNTMNGAEALSFARERYSFAAGDRQRVADQQAVIDAIIKKATSTSILTKYDSLLSTIEGKFQTNLSSKKITSLIKKQISNNTAWTVSTYSLDGSDSYEATYSYGSQKLYVMIPDEDTVSKATELINQVLNGEIFESSFNQTGATNEVTHSNNTVSYDDNNTDENNNQVDNDELRVTIVENENQTTSDSISITVNSKLNDATPADISSYEYIIDGKEYACDSSNCTFDDLKPETSYKISVIVTDVDGRTNGATAIITTKEETDIDDEDDNKDEEDILEDPIKSLEPIEDEE